MFAHFTTWIKGLICSTLQIHGKRNWSQGIVYTVYTCNICVILLLWAGISQRFLYLPLQVSALCRLCLMKIRSWSRTVFGHSWVGTLHRLNLVHDKTKNYQKFKHFHLSSFITPLQLLHWMVLSLPKGQAMDPLESGSLSLWLFHRGFQQPHSPFLLLPLHALVPNDESPGHSFANGQRNISFRAISRITCPNNATPSWLKKNANVLAKGSNVSSLKRSQPPQYANSQATTLTFWLGTPTF